MKSAKIFIVFTFLLAFTLSIAAQKTKALQIKPTPEDKREIFRQISALSRYGFKPACINWSFCCRRVNNLSTYLHVKPKRLVADERGVFYDQYNGERNFIGDIRRRGFRI